MSNPDELLTVKPLTTVDGILEYSERTMRTIANTVYPFAMTVEAPSIFRRHFMLGLEPWFTTFDPKKQGITPAEDDQAGTGKMAKRISNYLFKRYNVELPERYKTAIGGFLSEEAPVGKQHYDQTNRFDWQAGDFGDHRACFLISRTDVIRAIEDEGGTALRFWKSPEGGKGVGRAWVMPTELGLPVVFNAYGPTLESYRSRLKLILPDVPTTMIHLKNHGETDGHFYINGGVGLLVGKAAEDFDLSLDLKVVTGRQRPRRCYQCDELCPASSMFHVFHVGHNEMVCPSCADGNYAACAITGNHWYIGDMTEVTMIGQEFHDAALGYRNARPETVLVSSDLAETMESCPRCGFGTTPSHGYFVSVSDQGQNSYICLHCAAAYNLSCRHCSNYLRVDEPCSCGEPAGRHRRRDY
jgi:hypothetical protein